MKVGAIHRTRDFRTKKHTIIRHFGNGQLAVYIFSKRSSHARAVLKSFVRLFEAAVAISIDLKSMCAAIDVGFFESDVH